MNLHYNRSYYKPKIESSNETIVATTQINNEEDDNYNTSFHKDEEEPLKMQSEIKKKKVAISKANFQALQEFNKIENDLNNNNYINPELVTSIKNNIVNLLDRINSNYDIRLWDKADTKSLFNRTNDVMFTPLTYYNMHHESETSKFRSTLQNKIKTLNTINESNQHVLNLFNKTTLHKDLEGKIKQIDDTKIKKYPYSQIDHNYISYMTNKHYDLYEKFKPTLMYNEFLSPTMNEFTICKGEKISKNRKFYLKEQANKCFLDPKILKLPNNPIKEVDYDLVKDRTNTVDLNDLSSGYLHEKLIEKREREKNN